MEEPVKNNFKLGLLVLAGLSLLILALYSIGKNQHLFGANFELKVRFTNASGLMTGNNIRFSGIQVGTVRHIEILNDTTIEVTMLIDKKVEHFIHINAVASIGTEGLMGNKVINITPSRTAAPLAEAGSMLPTQKNINTDEMLQTLYRTNNNIADISDDLKNTIHRIRNSTALGNLLDDSSLAIRLRSSLVHIDRAAANAQSFTKDIQDMIAHAKEGQGSIGQLITDTGFYHDLTQAVQTIDQAGKGAGDLIAHVNDMVRQLQQDIDSGHGAANALLRDSIIVMKLNASLDNIQKGTDGFNQNMEALKHNFLFRGYFRRLGKEKKKQTSNTVTR
jgi:phospholipid/cholesterol/gamma-HCH transport system substrate-binding protein